MRLKAALIIIVIAFVITAINFGSSMILTRNTLNVTMSEDISLALDIANDFISMRISLYKSNARAAAERLIKMDSHEAMETVMRELLAEYHNFMAFTVFDRQGIIAEYGDSPTSINWLEQSKYIESAFGGKTVISTTRYNEITEKLVMHICTPIDQNRILSVTISGMIFSDMLSNYILRDTRSIFMLDEYGTVIAHFLPEFVTSRINFKNVHGTLDSHTSTIFFIEMLSRDKGMGTYIIDGIEYQCAYAAVSASETGWHIGLSVPSHENLADKLQNRLLLLAVIFFSIGTVAAVVCSGQIAKPYSEHKLMMEKTRRLQTELEAALKEAQEANRAKSSFLANMSHEMRTPLNAIVGLSELMLNAGESSQPIVWSEVEDNLGKIYSSGITLLGIVNDILDISKIESGKFELHPINYSASSLINDIVSLNIVRIEEKPIQFILTVDEDLPERLFGDDLRVKQIFNNLLSNAFKYTNSGTVEWNMSFERDGDNIWLVSDVKDTGVGIKDEDIPKLFNDYTQVNSQAFRKAGSTGLGLSITKRFLDMMDGTITVENNYGKGMTFSVRLRQQFVSDVPIGKETINNIMNARFTDNKRAKSAMLERIDLSCASVLVVDDMRTNLDVARGMLLPYGLYVDCVISGMQAIEMIRKENPRYDAVFMDHMMPYMDGIETVRVIREEIGNDYAKNVPIIALTANAITGNEQMFLENGFQAFISKPIDMIRLDSALRRWIKTENIHEKRVSQAPPPPQLTFPGGITIDGIDIDSRLESFLGNEEMFIKVLQSYMENTRPLFGIIEKYLENGNMKDYAVAVHGIKGSSYCIGAMRAGAEAERLERLAKADKTEQVLVENGAFIETVEKLLDSIKGALAKINIKSAKPPAACPDPEILRELREACAEYDVGKVDKIMEKLESFEYENGAELVAWLHRQVDEMSFSEISGGNWPK